MPCKTCKTANGLAVCLFCGHSFCGSHRSERDGAAACTACQEAEHARSSGRKPATPAPSPVRAESASPAARAPKAIDTSFEGVVVGAPAGWNAADPETQRRDDAVKRAWCVLSALGVGGSFTAAMVKNMTRPDDANGALVIGLVTTAGLVVGALVLPLPFLRSEKAAARKGGLPPRSEPHRPRGAPAPAKATARRDEPAGIGTPVSELDGGAVTATLKPLQPIPEAGWTPVLVGLAACGITGAYLWVFAGWLLAGSDAVAIARPALTAVGAALAFAGVWIITKSRLS